LPPCCHRLLLCTLRTPTLLQLLMLLLLLSTPTPVVRSILRTLRIQHHLRPELSNSPVQGSPLPWTLQAVAIAAGGGGGAAVRVCAVCVWVWVTVYL